MTVKQYGNALLYYAMKDLIPMLKAFDSWKELYALALTRVMDYTPLKRVKAVWEKLYLDIKPQYKEVISSFKGLNREG